MITIQRLRELIFLRDGIRVIDLQSGKIGLVGAINADYSNLHDPVAEVKVIFDGGSVWTTAKNVKEISPLEELARIEEEE